MTKASDALGGRGWAVWLAWLVLGVFSILVALTASARYPVSELEQQVSILPAGAPSGLYLERVLVQPLMRWDALFHFPRIVREGYVTDAPTLAFYPLYPLSARVLHLAGVATSWSLLLVSWAATLGYLLVFRRLAALDQSAEDATWATILLLVFPMSIMLYLPYMESLFLLLAAAALYFARRRAWLRAGVAGMLATLTKQPGVLLIIPLAIEAWTQRDENSGSHRESARRWLAIGLIPLAMAAWTLFRVVALETHFTLAGSLPELVLKLVVSSSAEDMVLTRAFTWPWLIIAEAIGKATSTPVVRLNVLFNLGGYVLMLVLFLLAWRSLRPAHRAYAGAVLLLTLLDYTYSQNAVPLPSMFRHAYLAFPVLLALPQIVRTRAARILWATISLVVFLLLMYAYVMKAWIV